MTAAPAEGGVVRCPYCKCAVGETLRKNAEHPRCATCRFWAGTSRLCLNVLASVSRAEPDFGCVLHEVAA